VKDGLNQRVVNDVACHWPDAGVVDRTRQVRAHALHLIQMIGDRVPQGREQASALATPEAPGMHASSGITMPFSVGE
jgi:hypothetical protein